MQDELLLLDRARSLDPDALTEIHNLYYAPLFRYILMRVNDHALAEDLTSDVFIRLLSALRDHTAPRNTLKGWLFAVASRVVNDHYRQHYRYPQTELDESVPAQQEMADERIENILSKEALREAVTELTEDQQNTLALRFGFGMSIQETAQVMDKSEGSIKMLQARAVAALARRLLPGRVSE
ncbi:MAG: sigma-70 family RNA polymerase sigma factor [Anaerolineales bacterium]|nr:sigma-70 family RNA polymerase sigma factor [Anaerolineales bacterium]